MMVEETSNTGAAATASGVDFGRTQVKVPFKCTPNKAYSSTAKSLGYALTLGTEWGWDCFTEVLTLRLSEKDRAAIGWAVLNSLDENIAHRLASANLFGVLDGRVI